MANIERKILVNLHSPEENKIPEKDGIRFGEIAVNHNSTQPFIAFKTADDNGNISFATTVTQAQLSNTAKEPSVENGILTIPYAYDELLTKYNDLLERLVSIENELGMSTPYASLEEVAMLSEGWKFKLISSISDINYTSTIEASTDFNDNSWETVNVPHDWSIYRDFNKDCKGVSDAGYLDGGDAWYRIELPITESMQNKKIFLYFDGIYMESDIYVNGEKVKTNKFGYNPFYVDATEKINFGGTNMLAVFVRNQQPSSRYYSGSGIIRNVALLVGHETTINIGNIIVNTPNIATEYQTTNKEVTTEIKVGFTSSETKKITAVAEILNNVDSVIGTQNISIDLVSGKTTNQTFSIKVKKPSLWSIGNGNLYKVKVRIKYDKSTIYKTTEFGYRWFTFDANNGFSLNGEKTFLKGVCLHEDSGCLGNEVNRSAYVRQIIKLSRMGVNAIRMCHNPFPKEFIDVCNEYGILLLADIFDEWNLVKKGSINETGGFYRYFDENYEEVVRNIVERDVNAPSIFGWLIGNEIIRANSYTQENALKIANNIKDIIREYDSYRPITMGDDTPSNSISLAIADILDIEGINYGSEAEYKNFRAAKPLKPLFGSETTSALSSRGVYSADTANKQCSSMDDQIVSWGEGKSAAEIVKRHMTDFNYLMGMFVWTGWDYIGEPTPYINQYPARSSYFGIIDLAGFPKDIYYMYQSRWSEEPMIHIVGNWEYIENENEGTERTIWLYSNCSIVELFLNGTTLGRYTSADMSDKYNYIYQVFYKPGTLVANGYDTTGNLIAQDVVYTSLGKANQIYCYCDTSTVSEEDTIFFECDIVDSHGIIVPSANDEIEFSNGKNCNIIATDNGDATNVENMRSLTKKAFNGKIMAAAKPSSTGQITITSNNFPLIMKETVKCGSSTVYRERNNVFIDAENPPIYSYHFDDPNFVELGTSVGISPSGKKATDELTGKTLKWSLHLIAIGYDSYIASSSSTGAYNEPIKVDNTINGVYSIVMTPSKNYSGLTFTILEINDKNEVTNTIDNVVIDKLFALQKDTQYIMLNMRQTWGFSVNMFNSSIKVGIRSYPDYNFVSPTSISFNGTINKLSSLIGGKESIFDFISYLPEEAYPAIQRNAVITSQNENVAIIDHTNIVYKGIGDSTINIAYKDVTASTQLTISENQSEWDAEWDGSTNSLSDLFTLQSMKFVENTYDSGNTYMLVPTATNGEIKVKNSASNTLKFEADVIFKTTAQHNNWPWGMDATAGDNYGASVYIPNQKVGTLYFTRSGNNYAQNFSADTLYTFSITIDGSGAEAKYTTTMNGSIIVDNATVPSIKDPLTECKVWSVNENYVILGIRYKKQ